MAEYYVASAALCSGGGRATYVTESFLFVQYQCQIGSITGCVLLLWFIFRSCQYLNYECIASDGRMKN